MKKHVNLDEYSERKGRRLVNGCGIRMHAVADGCTQDVGVNLNVTNLRTMYW